MSKAASHSKLAALHAKFASYLEHVLDEAMTPPEVDENGNPITLSIPLDAATMGCISKFLKDNEITCEPAELGTLDELREKYSKQAKERQSNVRSLIEDAQSMSDYIN